jgi:hypothetical protein
MAKQAVDAFVTTMPDGSERAVAKGQVLVDNHEIVKHAPSLFVDFDVQEAKRPRSRKASS